MKNLIESNIHWNKIGSHPKESYSFHLGKAKMSKDGSVLTLAVELNFVVPYEDILRIKALIINQVPDLVRVDFQFHYRDMILKPEEILRHYIEYMIEEVNGEYAPLTKTILPEEYALEGDSLTIYALGNLAVEQLNHRVSPLFRQLLEANMGLSLQVRFENHDDSYSKVSSQKKALTETEAREMAQVQKSAVAAPKKSAEPQEKS